MLFVLALIVALLWIPSPWDWALVGTAAVIEIGESFFWLWWNRRRRPQVGIETLIGRRATVAAACRPAGQVRVDGELWQAVCKEGADVGEGVVIEQVDRLTLLVRPEG